MNAPEQFSFPELTLPPMDRRAARAAAELGMGRAIDKAERTAPGWTDEALNAIRTFARNQQGSLWTIEMARWAVQSQIPAPPDLRSWGAVTAMAVRRGYITKTKRTAPTASSNGSDRPLYRSGPAA